MIRRIAALGVVAGAAALARAHTLAPVAPELRTRALWVPLAVSGRPAVAVARRIFPPPTESVAGVTVSRHEVPGGLDVFVYEAEGRSRPGGALLWIHGGGTIIGAPEGDHDICSRLARDVEPGMYHAAEVELHATVPAMRAFRQAMTEALAEAIGG